MFFGGGGGGGDGSGGGFVVVVVVAVVVFEQDSKMFPSLLPRMKLLFFAFHGEKMCGKDHCRVIHCTTGRIKARNPAEHLSFSFSNKAKYRNRR